MNEIQKLHKQLNAVEEDIFACRMLLAMNIKEHKGEDLQQRLDRNKELKAQLEVKIANKTLLN